MQVNESYLHGCAGTLPFGHLLPTITLNRTRLSQARGTQLWPGVFPWTVAMTPFKTTASLLPTPSTTIDTHTLAKKEVAMEDITTAE